MEFEWPEGATPLDPDEAEGLIPFISTQGQLNEYEAMNILDGVEWAGKSRIIKSRLLNQETLKLLHQQMFGKTWRWAGRYRLTQKTIGCDASKISMEMKMLLDDVTFWLEHKTYTPKELVTRFHHRLVLIHPFVNGNGRFSRVATELLCEQQKWDWPTWGRGSGGDVRKRYIECLQQADRSDYRSLIAFLWS